MVLVKLDLCVKKYERRPAHNTKINWKRVKDLDLPQHTVKKLKLSIGNTSIGKNLVEKTLEALTSKAKINKWITLRSVCNAKETVNKAEAAYKMEQNVQNLCKWENINTQDLYRAPETQQQQQKQSS